MTANGQLVRQYDLSYGNGFKNINLLLSSITESGVDEMGATTTLPAYPFDYNPALTTWTLDPNFATSSMDFFVASGSASGGRDMEGFGRSYDRRQWRRIC